MSRPSGKPFAAKMNDERVTIKKPPESARHSTPDGFGGNEDEGHNLIITVLLFKGITIGVP